MQVGGPGSQETWDNICPLIKASLSLWSQQSFSNKAQATERSPMLPWAPSCLWGDSCTVVIPPAHQRPVFFISLFAQVSCYQLTQQRSQSSPGVFVNILQLTCLQFVMCVYFFSAGVRVLWLKQMQPQLLSENTPFWLFCLNTWVEYCNLSLFFMVEQISTHGFGFHYSYNQLFVFTLPCFFYGSHVLCLQLRDEFLLNFPPPQKSKHRLDGVYLKCFLIVNILSFSCRNSTVMRQKLTLTVKPSWHNRKLVQSLLMLVVTLFFLAITHS